jgi:hypothetical protein
MNPTYDELLTALRSLVIAVGFGGHIGGRLPRDERLADALAAAMDVVLRAEQASTMEAHS